MNLLVRTTIFAILSGSVVTACGGGSAADDSIGSSSSNDVAIDSYGKTFLFDVPEPCELYVVRRAAALDAHIVEYDLRADGLSLAVVYKMLPGDPLPVEADVTSDVGAPILSLRMSDTALSVRDARGIEALGVSGYLGGNARVALGAGNLGGGTAVATGLRALACLLPAQTALGFVPDMFMNRAGGLRTGDGVSGRSADAPKLVDWNAPVTLLGALWIAAKGVVASADGTRVSWAPSCATAKSSLMGVASTPCGASHQARAGGLP